MCMNNSLLYLANLMTPLSGLEMSSTAAAILLGGEIVKWASASALAAELRVAGFSEACDALGEASPQWLAIKKHLDNVRPDNPGVILPAHDGEEDTDEEETEAEGNNSEDDDGAEDTKSESEKPAKKKTKHQHGLFFFRFFSRFFVGWGTNFFITKN